MVIGVVVIMVLVEELAASHYCRAAQRLMAVRLEQWRVFIVDSFFFAGLS